MAKTEKTLAAKPVATKKTTAAKAVATKTAAPKASQLR